MRSLAIMVLLAPLVAGRVAFAAERSTPSDAKIVAFWIDGSLGPERTEALVRLVRAELALRGLRLEVMIGAETTAASRPAETSRNERVRVDASLDIDASGWLFRIEDVQSGRTHSRRLPGADADAAALEAVAAILDSAIGAIEAGAAFGDTPEGTQPIAKKTTPAGSDVATPPEAVTASRIREPTAAPAVAWLGGLGISAASIEGGFVSGLNASFAVRQRALGVRLGAGLFFPYEVETTYGAFRLQRSTIDLRAQLALAAGLFCVLPELGPTFEVVRRTDTEAGPGVVASSDTSHLRAGAAAGMRWSYPLAPFAAVELGVHVEYYLRSLRFSAASAPREQIFALAPFLIAADLALALGSP